MLKTNVRRRHDRLEQAFCDLLHWLGSRADFHGTIRQFVAGHPEVRELLHEHDSKGWPSTSGPSGSD